MLSTENPPAKEGPAQPTVEERRALLDRMAASGQFRRSARLRDFLLYVGNQSLKNGSAEIHEQEIGTHVFGRSPSYDTSQDNIVRVNATELRKRIEQYFATEGVEEPLLLEIPRGGYRPIFHRRLPQPSKQPIPAELSVQRPILVAPPHHSVPPQPSRTRVHLAWGALCLALLALCAYLYRQNRVNQTTLAVWDDKPALGAFWEDFLRYRGETDLVLPDDSLSLVVDLVGHPISLGDYLSRDYMRQVQSANLSADRKSDLDQIYSHNLVTFGNIRAAQFIQAQIPGSYPTHLTLARYYAADALKRNNVVLIGGKKANPWVHLFDDQTNFITDFSSVTGQAFVSNRHPRGGELSVYTASHDPNALAGYSVIAYLPNPSHTGNTIILAGTDSDATDAAGEFLTSEQQMETFRNTLHTRNFPYFEILLKTSRLSGTSFNSEVLAYRSYPDLH